MVLNGTIQELLTLDEIENAEQQYKSKYGKHPFSLSTWNPSVFYREKYLLSHVVLPPQPEPINYIYSYELDPRLSSDCARKITGTDNACTIITNSGTASIALVSSVLSAMDLCRVLVVSPTYYAVLYNCMQKQMKVHELHMLRVSDGYRLPQTAILQICQETDAIWLTNPIYNTSVYLSELDQEFLLNQILPNNFLVVDECFCKNGCELSRQWAGHPHFIGIYDPMKQFLVNGAKFSAIVIPPNLENLFCQWSDISCGSLTVSTIQAMEFYLSAEAEYVIQVLEQANSEILRTIRMIASRYPVSLWDSCINGHMLMCYIPKFPANMLESYQDFFRFQDSTAASIIPGSRFHFPNDYGFSFRINLARFDPILFPRALERVLSYFSND